MSHRSKTSSRYGVLPVSVYTKPYNCGGSCLFCPSAQGIPKSYLPNKDTLTAKRLAFDPASQLKWKASLLPSSLRQADYPFEIIVIGGSFSSLSKHYRRWYIGKLYSSMNTNKCGHSPVHHEKYCEFQGRCSVLTVESRPDQITKEECIFLRELGVTKVELGVQHTNDKVLATICRGHQQIHITEATRLLKDHGFKVGYHIMLGLPGATFDDDILMLSETIWLSQYHPDYLKIYPCTLLKDKKLQPELHSLYLLKCWSPPSEEYCQACINALSKAIPKYVRVSRIQRQFSNNDILTGPKKGLRTRLSSQLNDLRAREAGSRLAATDTDLIGLSLTLNKVGNDQYIELIKRNDDILLAIARITKTSDGTCFLRELKVFGETNPIGFQGQVQGRGLGSNLLFALEYHFYQKNVDNIFVNASIGAKSFFTQYGYAPAIGNLLKKNLKRTSFNNRLHLTRKPVPTLDIVSSDLLLPS